MNMQGTIISVLMAILLITQLPTMFCVLAHSPDGNIEDTSTTETTNNIKNLVQCITPTSAFGLILFVVGGFVTALLNQ